MSSFDLTRPVVRELRAAKPVAPEALRERVAGLGARREPEARFSLPTWLTVRRIALVAAPAVVVVGVGAALIHGIANSGAPTAQPTALHRDKATTTALEEAFGGATTPHLRGSKPTTPVYGAAKPKQGIAQLVEPIPSAQTTDRSALPPSKTRLQDYRASLTVRVEDIDELSPATQHAMRTARALGGYVVSAQFEAAKRGYSTLVFRVPVTRVQQAIAKFSGLGTIAAQDIRITDLQVQFNRLVRRINAMRIALAKVDDKLAEPSLSNEERVRLQQRRARLVATLEALTTSKGSTQRRAQLATVGLTLTTQKAAAHKEDEPGPLGRAFDDAGTILAKELSWALYALVVAGPLLVLALLAFLGVRLTRRYADRRLLESS